MHSTVEVLMEDFGTQGFTTLPIENHGSTLTLSNGAILLCGGIKDMMKCIQWEDGIWKEHSTLNVIRVFHSAVVTQTATFLFGGMESTESYEYLSNNSNTWLMGKTKIPGGFCIGYAIASKDGEKIWLIGGDETEKRILSFNIKEHTFQELPAQLNVGRISHRCAFIPNTNKIMVTGGCNRTNVSRFCLKGLCFLANPS